MQQRSAKQAPHTLPCSTLTQHALLPAPEPGLCVAVTSLTEGPASSADPTKQTPAADKAAAAPQRPAGETQPHEARPVGSGVLDVPLDLEPVEEGEPALSAGKPCIPATHTLSLPALACIRFVLWNEE